MLVINGLKGDGKGELLNEPVLASVCILRSHPFPFLSSSGLLFTTGWKGFNFFREPLNVHRALPDTQTAKMAALRSQPANFVDLNSIAEGVVDEEASSRHGAAIFSGNAGGLQFGAQGVDVRAFEAEMAIGIRAGAVFFDGNMDIQAARLEPDAAAIADGIRLGNFAQAEQAGVEGARGFFAAFRHGDVDVGEAHGIDEA